METKSGLEDQIDCPISFNSRLTDCALRGQKKANRWSRKNKGKIFLISRDNTWMSVNFYYWDWKNHWTGLNTLHHNCNVETSRQIESVFIYLIFLSIRINYWSLFRFRSINSFSCYTDVGKWSSVHFYAGGGRSGVIRITFVLDRVSAR